MVFSRKKITFVHHLTSAGQKPFRGLYFVKIKEAAKNQIALSRSL